jgi:hypothetical protein
LKDIRAASARLALTSLTLAQTVGAADATPALSPQQDENARIAYEAPSSCPDAMAFMERLRARTARGALASPGQVARFVVIVSSTETASSARLELGGAGGQSVARTVTGRTCDEVVSAAALITALAIEAVLGGAAQPRAPEDQSTPSLPRDPPILVPSEPRERWVRSWGLGVTAGLDAGTPGGGYAWGAFGELAGRAPFERVRLTIRGTTGSASIDGRSASFDSLMARISLCPFSLRLADPLALLPCAAADAGRLVGRGEPSADLREPRSAAILWLAAGAVVSLRWQLGALMAIEAGGELGFPLVRHTFVFEWPTRLVYEVPVLAGGVFASVALVFH